MTARWRIGFIGILGIGALACGGSGPTHVEISDKSPTEGAAIAANAVCSHLAACGEIEIGCTTGGAAGGSGSSGGTVAKACTGTIAPGEYAKCDDEASTDIAKLLACPSITPADVNELELCFDALDAEPCPTQAEADAMARAEEQGTIPPTRAMPPECALLATPPPGC